VTVTRGKVRALQRAGLATEVEGLVVPTPDGWRRACEIVRNHRLWELYLTNAAQVAPDHVHDDAEVIEHVLGNETVRRLERSLNYARRDPHGKLIPGLADLEFKPQPGPRAPGFGTGGRMP
jgi:manganese/zinc/iron transport system permease protein